MSDTNKDKDFAPINIDMNDRIQSSNTRAPATSSHGNAPKGSNLLSIIALIIGLGACGTSVYLYNLHEANVALLDQKERRLLSLEDRLSATGEEMGNSTVALQVKVGELSEKSEELWDQMDKLWASAWRRNQAEIKTLNEDTKKLSQDMKQLIASVNAQIGGNEASIQQIQNRIDGVNAKFTGQANDMLAVTVNQEALQNEIDKKGDEVRQLNEKIILLERRNTNLLQQVQELESKLNALINKSV